MDDTEALTVAEINALAAAMYLDDRLTRSPEGRAALRKRVSEWLKSLDWLDEGPKG